MALKTNVMKKLLLLFCFSLLIVAISTAEEQNISLQKKSAIDLIERTIPGASSHFIVEIVPCLSGEKDYFEVDKKNSQIVLRGTNGVSVASAFYFYLKNYANGIVTWNGNNLSLSDPLVFPEKLIRKETLYDYRYYLNYCTFSYSMSWWDWERWEKEIDWMAMHGINFPLSLTGQNEILYRVFTQLGMSEEDLHSYFVGPAYFAWFWMNNIDGWGGPLPRSLMKDHFKLQKKILERQRALGMKPILPSFTGHVPPKFKEYFPKVKLNQAHWKGTKFDKIYTIDPTDPMFKTIGRMFLDEQAAEFGTDHYYTADVFNEVDPPTKDSVYLDNMGKRIYDIMHSADKKAVWVMQGWLFYHSRQYWSQREIKILLDAVPDDNMIILDLYSENIPVWQRTDSYYNKPWIWNMLHCFGGNNGLYGCLDSVAVNPSRDFHNPASKRMKGIGLSMEAIEQNPVVYELMMENVWSDSPIEIKSWLKSYSTNRYGKFNLTLYDAWLDLYRVIYSHNGNRKSYRSVLLTRPFLKERELKNELWYNPKDLEVIWGKFISISSQFKNSEGFKYDIVDITRQVLTNRSHKAYEKMYHAYINKDLVKFQRYGKEFLSIAKDLDEALSSRPEFLLGKWINDARKLGYTAEEKELYEKNARNQITLWGGKNSVLHEYASKQWNGLIQDFYIPRWEFFIRIVTDDLKNKRQTDFEKFEEDIKEWEWSWVNSATKYPDTPTIDAVEVCKKMYKKYSKKTLD
ncbi:MAG TPA: alpha-N-acetylglucosaminidase [Paludibacter sp.]|nr:alpha-N-acetylglucosaminidase [Paludibacter sp.]